MIKTSAGAVFDLSVHIVFVTKYRRRVLTRVMLDRLDEVIRETALTLGTDIVEINGEPDHVHLLINYPPKHSISTIAGRLKGVTSRKLRLEFGPEMRRQLWGNDLWTDSYFATSTGGAPLDVVRRYITNQNRPE
jgi:putative transposase